VQNAPPPRPIVVLISGRGSNMQALVDSARRERWRARWGADITAVIADRPQAAGLAWARDAAGLATDCVDFRAHAERGAFERALAAAVDRHQPALLLLAGFMRILSADFVARYAGRMLNIHPSLLPAFPGLHTHRRALEAGVAVHGATVHHVTPELDAGPIVAQAVVPVLAGDDEPTLAARVLAVEHRLYPRAVRGLLERMPV
jgi:phosphoribosylglycinamide formyltransferase-1